VTPLWTAPAAAGAFLQASAVPYARRPDALRGRVFRKRDVLARGLLTEGELRSSAWRRLFRGVYADAGLPDSFGLRVAGARLLIPSEAVFSGRTAAFLHGATELADVRDPVEVSVPTGVRFGPVAGLRIRQVRLSGSDVVLVSTRPCTNGLRTALDIARHEPLMEAIPALDVLLSRAVVGKGELEEAATGLIVGRGAARARKAVELANPLAESQPESRLRVILALAGLHPVPQYGVRDADGKFVARVDLAFVEQRVAIEYDGAWHAEPGQFAKDRRRLNRLRTAGWTVLHVTAADLRDLPALVASVEALLAAATSGN
jgi:G:T-mismatch repair DNA endonuclease (very short patch repair protein)